MVGDWWHKFFIKIQWKPWLLWQPQGSIDLQWENACHYHNCFSFGWMFLKLADKVNMDKISDKFENWPDRIMNLTVTSPWLLKKPKFNFVIRVTHSVLIGCSWNADKVDMDKISDKFENWPDRIINLRVAFPWLLKKPLFDFVISISQSVFYWIFLRLAATQ